MARKKKQTPQPEEDVDEEEAPAMEPADSDGASSSSGDDDGDDSSEEEYDSAAEHEHDDDDRSADDDDPQVSDDYYDDDDDEFEEQGSSDDDEDDRAERQGSIDDDDDDDDDEEVEILDEIDVDAPRAWPAMGKTKRGADGRGKEKEAGATIESGQREQRNNDKMIGEGGASSSSAADVAKWMHADDLSSDDEDGDGAGNRIGRVPLHWYDDHEHIGYDAHGDKVIKSSSANKDLLDRALDAEDRLENNKGNKFTVHDALNAKDVELTPRQIELVRRLQSGAYAHPEHDAHPDYVDYYSGVDPMKSGLNSDRYEKKSRFQPSKWEKLQVRRLLHRLKCGSISMDFLEGKVRDMNDLVKRGEGEDDTDRPFALWKGDEEDELALRKGPQHMPAPKVPPPGHAYSYNPPEEYLPNEEELREWAELDPEDRPHGHFVPQKFANLRSVGAYEHSVKERFERCLDLYLCPRAMKRRLNIDPESLVPRLPRASDLRPFPTTRCVRYVVPNRKEHVVVRCLTVSPDGQFLASGDEDGVVRLWEVQTGRLLRSWNLMEAVDIGEEKKNEKGEEEDDASDDDKSKTKPIASLEWNPSRSHHVLLAAVGKCAVVISTGTGGPDESEVTDALLSSALSCKNGGGNISSESRAAKAVSWTSLKKRKFESSSDAPVSAFGGRSGPVRRDVASVKWHRKGDYFVTVSPKAGAAAVLIHQLSKASSQQPFGKNKGGEAQLACFHPRKPFLFVATKEHIKVYHLVKQAMVKRLMSGCRHISSLDVHGSGDHVVAGGLDRRLAWFDLDLSSAPYKTLRYHEKAIRSVGFHPRYPLMASASDDGTVHVFHATVYSDLMRNPLIVPVKVLRAHTVTSGLGALGAVFHPTQPWLFSGGADGNIHLFQDL
eukprot:CAMPEP_0181138470 /NCGR_PEP_ID=MMETSP1071-20121207/34265_1 /TAXON_ID=35127 /ORGANISM="Thalassiosira sp., Strain NH16" /LENGTH=888 /DNA_ID=CAMNT_0023225311 /DNA_START=837 /DNA_END=3503 /DNA_ORIENTATION=+